MQINKTMTRPSKVGKQPIPVWEATNLADFEKTLLLSIGGRRWKGAVSFFEDPSEKIQHLKDSGKWNPEQATAERVNHLESKIEKRQDWAESRQAKQSTCYERAEDILSYITPGQPILVGHHSEKRHRGDLKKVDNAYRKAGEHQEMKSHHIGVAQTHSYTIKKLNQSPRYWTNKLKKIKHRINQLKAWQQGKYYITDKVARYGVSPEKIVAWQAEIDSQTIELKAVEAKIEQLKEVAV